MLNINAACYGWQHEQVKYFWAATMCAGAALQAVGSHAPPGTAKSSTSLSLAYLEHKGREHSHSLLRRELGENAGKDDFGRDQLVPRVDLASHTPLT